jgi:uncharacterized protein HemX
MNDHAPGGPDGPGDDDQPGDRELRKSVERALMDRARRAAERDQQKSPQPILQHSVALAAAVLLVLVLTLGFDAFLSSMQRVMRLLDEEAARQEQQQKLEQQPKPPDPAEPMPAYVVPAD